ncbi:Pre-mrna-splicing factor slu7 [Thalictrum thalictroides]|uniref:Pre-mRNA-splicing factor SLU7 n=1 Tax=Thalictrum thalictroides TaxID=46969 RepID=A0A7J6VP53_THATH|nr:Pre-mrna-splicing factor slu7 [Thalictrum thalictroides]
MKDKDSKKIKDEKPYCMTFKKWKSVPPNCGISVWYDRGAKTYQSDRYRKGACENCGAKTHVAKSCTERTRLKGAKWTGMFIAPDEKIESIEMDYVSKRDRWNGCDLENHARELRYKHYTLEDARRRYSLKILVKKRSLLVPDGLEGEDELMEGDEEKLDERKQMDFAKVERRVCTTGGGSTGTVRNLRIREDTAKYLLNLDLNSAHYDPNATRSMREDPLPYSDPHEKFYQDDNQHRTSGLAMEFNHLNIHACQAYENGQDMHLQAAPSQAELMYKSYLSRKEESESMAKDALMQKYGNAAAVAATERASLRTK